MNKKLTLTKEMIRILETNEMGAVMGGTLLTTTLIAITSTGHTDTCNAITSTGHTDTCNAITSTGNTVGCLPTSGVGTVIRP